MSYSKPSLHASARLRRSIGHSKLSLVILLVAAAASAQSPVEFEPYTVYPLGYEAQTAAIGDLNGDGRDDIAVAAWPAAVLVFYQQADGALAPPVELSAPTMPLGLAVADLDGDGRNDLAAGGTDGLILLYYQQPDGSLASPVQCYSYGTTTGLAVADLNGDGLADIAVSTSSYAVVFVFLQSPTGGFGMPAFYAASGTNGRSISVLDWNQDGRPDLAVLFDDTISCLLQNSSGGFDAGLYLPAVWAHSLASGDVTGDGRDDLVFTVAANQPEAAVGVYAGRASLVTYPAYDFPGPVAIADLDGDGRKDVLAAHTGYQSVSVFHQNADGTLGAWTSYPVPGSSFYQPGALAVGDLNSDGRPDIALADPWNGLVVLLHTKPADVVPPVCSSALAGTDGLAGWYVSPVMVTLAAVDNEGGSGVKSISYTTDGVAWLDYSGPITVSALGVTRLGYYAEDQAGNRSDAQWVEVKIDSESPSVSLAPGVSTLWPPNGETVEVPVEVGGADVTSGLAWLHLKVSDEYGLVQPEMDVLTGLVMVPLVASRNDADADGRLYTLVLTGADTAGNVSSAQATVTVPRSSPKKVKPRRR